jgi:hypothetical protein
MQLTEKHIIKSTDSRFAQIDKLALASKNLYNAANYVLRQNFRFGWGYLNYNKMYNRFIKLVYFHHSHRNSSLNLFNHLFNFSSPIAV